MRKIIIILRLSVVIVKVFVADFIAKTKMVFSDNTGLAHPVELSMNQITESLARTFYPAIVEFFEKEENQKAYEEWKKNRELNKTSSPN